MTTLAFAILATAAAATAAAVPEGYLRVPGGLAHASCVHGHAHGATLDAASLPLCAHPFLRSVGTEAAAAAASAGGKNATHGAAWKAWAQFAAGGSSSVSTLVSSWAVPEKPASVQGGVTLFWWNGVEPADTSAVLQPVIQWGSSAAGGGDYWAYSSWYVSSAHGSHFSPLVKIQSGDVVTGYNLVDKAGAWAITCAAPGRANSTLNFKPVAGAWATAFHVLEAYGVTNNCDAYPKAGVVNFTNVVLAFDNKRPVSPIKWVPMTQTAGCNEHAEANADGSEVAILF